jgi:enoyl-[acyl-carrier-protein] reductase (NADH)
VCIGYQQRFFSRVRILLRQYPGIEGQRCDVLDEAELAAFFERFRQQPIDVLVHAVAFAAPPLFTKAPSLAEPDAFLQSLQITTWSLSAAVRHARPFLREWASVITLTSEASTARCRCRADGVAVSPQASSATWRSSWSAAKGRVNTILASLSNAAAWAWSWRFSPIRIGSGAAQRRGLRR